MTCITSSKLSYRTPNHTKVNDRTSMAVKRRVQRMNDLPIAALGMIFVILLSSFVGLAMAEEEDWYFTAPSQEEDWFFTVPSQQEDYLFTAAPSQPSAPSPAPSSATPSTISSARTAGSAYYSYYYPIYYRYSYPSSLYGYSGAYLTYPYYAYYPYYTYAGYGSAYYPSYFYASYYGYPYYSYWSSQDSIYLRYSVRGPGVYADISYYDYKPADSTSAEPQYVASTSYTVSRSARSNPGSPSPKLSWYAY